MQTLTARPLPHPALFRALTASVLFACALALAGCGQANGKTADKEAEPPAVPVEVAKPTVGEIVAWYSGTAPIEAAREALVVAKVSGEVREVLVEEGDRVRAGQVLARLDADRLRLEARQAEANFRKTERDYARTVELQQKGLVSQTALENLRYDLEALRATWELTRLNLSYAEIRAPIAGVIASRDVKVGAMVAANTLREQDRGLFWITDQDPLVLYVDVPERELRKLSPGQPADIQVDAAGSRRFAGRIALIAPAVDPKTATFKVKIEVKDDSRTLLPGMFARVNIAYERRAGALQVPRAALVEGDGSPSVFVVANGKAEARSVRTGLANGGLIEVTQGIQPGDQVVIVGQGALKPGTKVRVVGNPAAGKRA